MRRPKVAGLTLQAPEPLVQKLTDLEQQALRGESMSVVTLGAALATTLSTVGRMAMELVIQQAARAFMDLGKPTNAPTCQPKNTLRRSRPGRASGHG